MQNDHRILRISQTEICRKQKNSSMQEDLFTPEFKRLKARHPCPDLTGVVDLSRYEGASCCSLPVEKDIIEYPVSGCGLRPIAGLKPCEKWKCYKFSSHPGFIILQNPFIDGYQRYWVSQCLADFPSDRENVTNLTALGDNSSRDLWQNFATKKSKKFDKQDPLRKLRWTTLGYHYNWTTKEYSEDKKAQFPSDVSCLSQYLAACLGFAPYQAEAAIINYYHLDSTLAGHTDHSEIDHSAPLFSISFGQSAIFLLGGETKSDKPMSVLLKSGDVCVMSGKCRLAYHAVPKILAPSPEVPIPSCFNVTNTIHHHKCDRAASERNNHNVSVEMNNLPHCIMKGESSCRILVSSDTNAENYCTNSHHRHVEMNSYRQDVAKTVTVNFKNNQQNNEPANFLKNYDFIIDKVNSKIEEVMARLDFSPFEVYLQSSRLNLNIRQVLPPGQTQLENKQQSEISENSSSAKNDSLCEKLMKRDSENIQGLERDYPDQQAVSSSSVSAEAEPEPVCSDVDIVKNMKTGCSS